MKVWILKAVTQKVISFLPFRNSINYFFQKHVTKGVYLTDDYFFDRLEHAKEHIGAYKKYNSSNCPKVCLELGTGWYPVVPVALFLSGADKIYSVDISFLTSKERIKTTLLKFIESSANGNLNKYLSVLPAKFSTLQKLLEQWEKISLSEILEQFNISYLIEDARKLSLPDDCIDMINSNNTFEHIYPDILSGILSDCKRVVRKDGGIMTHFIDMSDHFAHFDKSITVYNFLQFSDSQWKWIDNTIQPQNRMRITDYKIMYKELDIPISEESFRRGNVEELKSIRVDKKYLTNIPEENAITHCHFVSVFK